MHRQAVKSNLSGTEKEKFGSKGYECDRPLCPKPRKLPPPIPDFLKPLTCTTHSSQPSGGKEEGGVLNMITEKNYSSNEKELLCSTGCLPSCYSGSPPRRTENPLIHDVEFLHQMDIVSSPFSRSKLSDKFAFTSA